jgi:hypothetical protein
MVTVIMLVVSVYANGKEKKAVKNAALIARVESQANLMAQAFLKGDYQTFARYTYPAILNAMGGEGSMITVLTNSSNNMKMQGMFFSGITFDAPTKIVTIGSEMQCTLQQHTTIKLDKGRAVATSTLIAISNDGGKDWLFVDTTDKDAVSMRQVIPNLSKAIIIPLQQKPIFYNY